MRSRRTQAHHQQQQQHVLLIMVHMPSSHESKDDQEASLDHQSARRHQAPVAPSAAAANLASALLQLFQQARSYTQQAHTRPVPETQCHCLVVDESLLVSVEDKQQFEKAIALGGDCKALEAHVISWLQPSPDDIHLTHLLLPRCAGPQPVASSSSIAHTV